MRQLGALLMAWWAINGVPCVVHKKKKKKRKDQITDCDNRTLI